MNEAISKKRARVKLWSTVLRQRQPRRVLIQPDADGADIGVLLSMGVPAKNILVAHEDPERILLLSEKYPSVKSVINAPWRVCKEEGRTFACMLFHVTNSADDAAHVGRCLLQGATADAEVLFHLPGDGLVEELAADADYFFELRAEHGDPVQMGTQELLAQYRFVLGSMGSLGLPQPEDQSTLLSLPAGSRALEEIAKALRKYLTTATKDRMLWGMSSPFLPREVLKYCSPFGRALIPDDLFFYSGGEGYFFHGHILHVPPKTPKYKYHGKLYEALWNPAQVNGRVLVEGDDDELKKLVLEFHREGYPTGAISALLNIPYDEVVKFTEGAE